MKQAVVFSICDQVTGEVDRVITGPPGIELINTREGEFAYPGKVNALARYVDPVVGVEQGKLPLALEVSELFIVPDGVEAAVISGIPEGVRVVWPDGVDELVQGGSVTFRVTQPGQYEFQFYGVRYMPEEVTIGARY